MNQEANEARQSLRFLRAERAQLLGKAFEELDERGKADVMARAESACVRRGFTKGGLGWNFVLVGERNAVLERDVLDLAPIPDDPPSYPARVSERERRDLA